MGFALPMRKSKSHFSKRVIDFVYNIFEAGKRAGKAKPEEVVKRMRREKIDGKLAFSRKWLNEGKVKSLCGKFATKAKKGDGPVNPIDLESIPQEEIEEESNYQSALNFQNLTKDIIEEVESDIPDTQNPMWVKEINLCDLSKSLRSEESALKVINLTQILQTMTDSFL